MKTVIDIRPLVATGMDSPRTVLVIDVSPSMDEPAGKGTRLQAAQQASRAHVRDTAMRHPNYEIGIVSFCAWAQVIHPSNCASSHLGDLERAIGSLSTAPATNIHAGLKKAGQLLGSRDTVGLPLLGGLRKAIARRFLAILGVSVPHPDDHIGTKPKPDTRRIVLCSDGGHNSGPNPVRIASQLKADGIWIETLGFGETPEEVDEKTLKAIASRRPDGSPCYRFVRATGADNLIKEFKSLVDYIKPL